MGKSKKQKENRKKTERKQKENRKKTERKQKENRKKTERKHKRTAFVRFLLHSLYLCIVLFLTSLLSLFFLQININKRLVREHRLRRKRKAYLYKPLGPTITVRVKQGETLGDLLLRYTGDYR